MKLTIEKKPFSEALKRARMIAKPKSSLPVLSCVLLRATRGHVEIVANDLDVALTLGLECVTAEEGAALVSAARLAEAVAGMGGDTVELRLVKERLHISSGGDAVRLCTLEVGEFPVVQKPSEPQLAHVIVEDGALPGLLERVMPAVSEDSTRYVLNGVFFDGAQGLFVATDGRRMHSIAFTPMLNSATSAIVPRAALKLLYALASDERVELTFYASALRAGGAEWELVSKLIEGVFPSYQAVIPPPHSRKAKTSRARLLAALPIAEAVMTDASLAVRLTATDETTLKATSGTPEIGESEATLSGEFPEGFVASFDVDFLADMLTALRTDEVVVEMADAQSPALFKDGDFLGVLMPMRII